MKNMWHSIFYEEQVVDVINLTIDWLKKRIWWHKFIDYMIWEVIEIKIIILRSLTPARKS